MSSATIERLQCHYLVPVEHPAPDDVRVRLDEVVRRYLVEVCSRWLTQFLDPDNPSVWLIRQLNIDLSADIGNLENSELAEVWGRQLALSIIQTIATGADSVTGDMIRCYRNQAVYAAHFVADLAEGRAWSKWYYRPFDSVSSLSTSAAIRTVMTREPEQIEETLMHLATQKRLEPVLDSLSQHDASVIYSLGFSAGSVESSDAGSSSLIELALSVWASAGLELSSKRLATPHNALRLYVAMRERSATLDSSSARNTIDQLLHLAEVLRNIPQPAKLVAHLVAGELTEALHLLRDAGMMSYLQNLSFLQQVALGNEALIRRVAATVATSVAIRNQGKTGDSDGSDLAVESFTTLMGGIFLLMPLFLDLKLEELIAAAPYPFEAEEPIAPVLRYLLYLKCFGSLYARWTEVDRDPALLLLAGLEEAPPAGTLLRLDQVATSAMNDEFVRALMARLADYKYLEGRYFYVEVVRRTPDDSMLLLRDMKHDIWVYASYLPPEPDAKSAIRDILMHGLSLLQKVVAMEPEYLLLGPGCENLANLETVETPGKIPVQLVWTGPMPFPGAIPHRHDNASGEGNEEDSLMLWTETHALPQEIQAVFMRYLKRIQPASRDMDYLTLSQQHEHQQSLINNRDVDLVLSLLARTLMRSFARRLMGFDQSSMEYLYQNFLAGTSTVQVQQDLIEVQLPCSPLQVVLRMAGVDGQSYALPWLNSIQVTLDLTC